jgi:hypothetical protein
MASNNYAQKSRKLRLPPYVNWGVFKKSVRDMKSLGIPDKITVRAFPKVSDALASHITQAYRRLGLLDETRAPTADLKRLVAACDTPNWAAVLTSILKTAYQPIMATSGPYSREQVDALFAQHYEGQPSVHRKASTFLLSAMEEATIPVVGGDFGFRGRPAKLVGHHSANNFADRRQMAEGRSSYDLLMNDIYDPHIIKAGSEEERAIFTLARFFKSRQ